MTLNRSCQNSASNLASRFRLRPTSLSPHRQTKTGKILEGQCTLTLLREACTKQLIIVQLRVPHH
ncbi:hypothetical protein JZ751_000379 [Albula glossodonta]|uniref:Uncharacterized protein n=1 Tax=Albula glossodonta TaxID=121402 RepID=A0A8T2PW40_9TELE|nr:hypothetical protein JZ751_000379 [Albula glossodonta]